jgi:hypothetical protein
MADESLTLEGRKYVSSGRAARLYGYTKDYVGQLCRAGKLDAQLIGRSWYVSEDSIRKHKLGVHYTLKNPKKTRVPDVKRDESTIRRKAFSDDSREMLPRYESVSQVKENVSAHPVEQPPHYAEIPMEQDVHTDVIDNENVDLYPLPRKHMKSLDPLARADFRYESYLSSQEGYDSSDTKAGAVTHDDSTLIQEPHNNSGAIRSIPIRSKRRGFIRQDPSVSGVRVRNTTNRAVVQNRYNNNDISFNNASQARSHRSRRAPIDGVLQTYNNPSPRKRRERSMGIFLNDPDHVDQFQSKYGHRPLSQNHRDTVESRRVRRSFAVPVLGALIVFASFVLLYLLFS